MKTFQTILLAIFGFFILAGVIVIATFGRGGGGGGDVLAEGEVWGTLSASFVDTVVSEFNLANDNILTITYREFPPETFNQELIEALAAGRGPDAVIFTEDLIASYEDKLYTIPFATFSERSFRDIYVEGSELFLNAEGVLAFPIAVDPMVLYWNRALFNTARISAPPSYWDELITLSKSLTKTDSSFNVLQSVIALGEYRNVTHAKEILSMLVMQAGNPIVIRDAQGRPDVIFAEELNLPEAPAESALRFYTEFANPVKPVYSWNRSLPPSIDMFTRGDLAMYLGFGSEIVELQERNPNLNFDVTNVPQIRDSSLATTFGTIYAIGLMKASDNIAGAFSVATLLSGADAARLWADIAGVVPARRDLLAESQTDKYKSVLYEEALIARGFLDPAPVESDTVFADLVETITSGRDSISRAVEDAQIRLQTLFE
ncbi:MAG: extracellular solute-binding protein [Patescibacteria group bacterium]